MDGTFHAFHGLVEVQLKHASTKVPQARRCHPPVFQTSLVCRAQESNNPYNVCDYCNRQNRETENYNAWMAPLQMDGTCCAPHLLRHARAEESDYS